MSSSSLRISGRGRSGRTAGVLDRSDLGLLVASAFSGFESSDGLVGRCSNRFATVPRDDRRTNHFDRRNRFFGLRSFTNPFSVYRSHPSRLRNVGL